MFSNEDWLATGYPRNNARQLYDAVLHPALWELGRTEAQALALARQQWQPRQTYLFYQPSFNSTLW